MKAIVRDDIISLTSYVDAEFKYKKYLELIQKAGNYCFLDQFKKLIDGGENIARCMVESNLIATENLNNSYKYIYLTDTAMKYLELRNSNEDFSDVKKNALSVKKVKKNPSGKQLFSSAFKFHLLINESGSIDKSTILKEIEDRDYQKIQYTKDKAEKFDKDKAEKWIKDKAEKWIKDANENIDELQKKIYEEITQVNLKQKYFEEYNSLSNRNDTLQLSALIKKDGEIHSEIEAVQNTIRKKGLDLLNDRLQDINQGINYIRANLAKSETVKDNHNRDIGISKEQIETYKSDIKKIENNKILIKDIIETKIKPRFQQSSKIFENLYDISKIIARIKDKTLEFIILDTGNFKTAYGYLKQVNSIKELKLGIEDINIIIYSYADNRASNLLKEFERVKNEKEKALNTMKTYNLKTKNSSTKSDFYIAAEKTYNNTPDFKVEVKEDLYYMAKYISAISDLDKAIKLKDKKAINNLINKFK